MFRARDVYHAHMETGACIEEDEELGPHSTPPSVSRSILQDCKVKVQSAVFANVSVDQPAIEHYITSS